MQDYLKDQYLGLVCIIPVHKKGSIIDSILAAIFCQSAWKYNEISDWGYFCENDLFNKSQYEFRKRLSTSLAISDLNKYIY